MKNLFFALIATLFLTHINGLPTSLSEVRDPYDQRRSTNTCGDPSVAVTYFEGFNTRINAHALEPLPIFVSADTVGGDSWMIDAPAFRAWLNPGQLSTVPFYMLLNPTTSDYVYLISTTGSPPTRSGFNAALIAGYVYPTQICNSVPLYSVFEPGDHWYTTNLAEHDYMLSIGWADGGIIAYVLPIDDFSQIVA